MRSRHSAIGHVAVALVLLITAGVAVATTTTGPTAYTVPPTIDPTGTKDVTGELTSFLRSVPDNSVVSFPSGATYRVEGTIELADRNSLTIQGNGATLVAKTDGTGVVSNLRTRYHWRLTRGSNITVRDLVVRGPHPNGGADGDYVAELEAQHGFDIAGTDGVLLERVRITDVYGDFVHASRDPRDFLWTRNLTIRNSHMERNGRQGIALTAVRGALVTGNTITNTRRATFDLEPDVPEMGAIDITIENNYIGPGRLYFIANAGADGTISNIRVRNNRLDRTMSIDVRPPDSGTKRRGPFEVVGNVSTAVGGSYYTDGELKFRRVDGLVVRDNVQAVKQYVDKFFAGVAYYETCGVDIGGNTFAGADAESHDFTPGYGCPEPPSGGGTSTDSTTTTVQQTTTTTQAPASSTTTSVTQSFSGSLNKANPVRTYDVTVGAGTLDASVAFKRAKTISLSLVDAAGATVAAGVGGDPLLLPSTAVGAGTYTLVVAGSTSANFTLAVTHPTP